MAETIVLCITSPLSDDAFLGRGWARWRIIHLIAARWLVYIVGRLDSALLTTVITLVRLLIITVIALVWRRPIIRRTRLIRVVLIASPLSWSMTRRWTAGSPASPTVRLQTPTTATTCRDAATTRQQNVACCF